MKNKYFNMIACLAILISFLGCPSTTDSEYLTPDVQNVEVHLQYGFVDEINTFEGIVIKDLVLDGSATAEFWFSTEDQESIRALADNISFFSIPNIIQSQEGVSVAPDPSPDQLRIKYGDLDHSVVWSYPGDPESIDFAIIIELSNFIMSIVQESDAYKALPEPKGGRL